MRSNYKGRVVGVRLSPRTPTLSLTGASIQGQDWTNPDRMVYDAGE